jgi:hypothetical protein
MIHDLNTVASKQPVMKSQCIYTRKEKHGREKDERERERGKD